MVEPASELAQGDPPRPEPSGRRAAQRLHVVPDPALEEPPAVGEESPTAGDMSRLAAWAAATFRPPQAWIERPLSASEALAAARNCVAPGRWAAARRGYGYGAALITAAAVVLVWLIQSPARLAVALLLSAVALLSAIALIP